MSSSDFFGVFVPGTSPPTMKNIAQIVEQGGGDSSKIPNDTDNNATSENLSSPSGCTTFVFREMARVLETMKTYKENAPRFKKFASFNEAIEFSRNGGCVLDDSSSRMDDSGDTSSSRPFPDSPRPATPPSPSVSSDGEQPRPFSAPTRPELTELKKAIESKNATRSAELIRLNPRYLINCNGDTPTIVQEGFRYNALHVAARSGDFDTAELILNLLKRPENIDYVRRLYPDDPNSETTEQRRRVLLDFYLNTPDKGCNDTPLHFAAKNGHLRLVELFLSFDECVKNSKNKNGRTARQLLLDYDKANPEEKETVLKRFGADSEADDERGNYFIALYRARDEAMAPILRKPVRKSPSIYLDHESIERLEGTESNFGRLSSRENSVCESKYRYDRLLSTIGTDGQQQMSMMEYRLAAYIGPISDEETARRIYEEWAYGNRTPEKQSRASTMPPNRGGKKSAGKGKKKSAKSSDQSPTNEPEIEIDKSEDSTPPGRPKSSSPIEQSIEKLRLGRHGRLSIRIDQREAAAIKRSDLHKGMERVGRRIASSNRFPWMEHWKFLDLFIDLSSTEGLGLLENFFRTKETGGNLRFQTDVIEKLEIDDEQPPNDIKRKLNFNDDDSSRDSADLYFDADESDEFDHDARMQPPIAPNRSPFRSEESSRDGFYTPPESIATIAHVIFGREPTKLDRDVLEALEFEKKARFTVDRSEYPKIANWLGMMREFSNDERDQWLPLDSPRAIKFGSKI